jgi:hypothetical protein
VYLQFAVSRRQQIVRLTDRLRKDVTFQIPGEERVATAEGKHEIRYFYKEDEPAVKELKAETEAALSDLGYEPVSIDPTPLLSFPAKPKHKSCGLSFQRKNNPRTRLPEKIERHVEPVEPAVLHGAGAVQGDGGHAVSLEIVLCETL